MEEWGVVREEVALVTYEGPLLLEEGALLVMSKGTVLREGEGLAAVSLQDQAEQGEVREKDNNGRI